MAYRKPKEVIRHVRRGMQEYRDVTIELPISYRVDEYGNVYDIRHVETSTGLQQLVQLALDALADEIEQEIRDNG